MYVASLSASTNSEITAMACTGVSYRGYGGTLYSCKMSTVQLYETNSKQKRSTSNSQTPAHIVRVQTSLMSERVAKTTTVAFCIQNITPTGDY